MNQPESPRDAADERVVLQLDGKVGISLSLPAPTSLLTDAAPAPEILTIEVNGVTVTGFYVSRTRREVVMEIRSPYAGYRRSHACGLFSLMGGLDYRGEPGEAVARDLLRWLYQACLRLDQALGDNGEKARLAYRRMLDDKAAVPPVSEATRQRHRDCLAALQAGLCSQEEYREALHALRSEQRERSSLLVGCEQGLLVQLGLLRRQPSGPYGQPILDREEVMAIVTGKRPLRRAGDQDE